MGYHAASVQKAVRDLEQKSNNLDSVCNCHELNTVLLDVASSSPTLLSNLEIANEMSLSLRVQSVAEIWMTFFKKTTKPPFKTYVKTRWYSRFDQVAILVKHWNEISKFVDYVENTLDINTLPDAVKTMVGYFKKITFKTLEHLAFFF